MKDIHYYEIIAAEINDTSPENIFIRTRKREILTARQMCIYYRKRVLKLSNAIAAGRYGLDHSTVNHTLKVIDDQRDVNKQFSGLFDDFMFRSLELRAREVKETLNDTGMFNGIEDVHVMIAKILYTLMKLLKDYSDKKSFQLNYMLKLMDNIESDMLKLKLMFIQIKPENDDKGDLPADD